jgi:hypothetical protein
MLLIGYGTVTLEPHAEHDAYLRDAQPLSSPIFGSPPRPHAVKCQSSRHSTWTGLRTNYTELAAQPAFFTLRVRQHPRTRLALDECDGLFFKW